MMRRAKQYFAMMAATVALSTGLVGLSAHADDTKKVAMSRKPEVEMSGTQMQFRFPHHFSIADARGRIQLLLEYWAERFGVKNHWSGNHAIVNGNIWGIDFDAEIDVEKETVSGKTSDPGGAFRDRVNDYIQGKVRKYLHPDYAEN